MRTTTSRFIRRGVLGLPASCKQRGVTFTFTFVYYTLSLYMLQSHFYFQNFKTSNTHTQSGQCIKCGIILGECPTTTLETDL